MIDEPEHNGIELDQQRLGDEGSSHQRGAGDKALNRHVRRQGAEALEGDRFAQVEAEGTCGFGREERAFGQAVEQEQRHAQRPGRNHDAGEVADHGAAERDMPER